MTHLTVLLHEAVDALNIRPGGIYVDATYGRGGHSAYLLSKLDLASQLIVLDQDPQAILDATEKYGQDPRVTIIHANFSHLEAELKSRNLWGSIDGILFDLGISSPQIDESERGFSFMQNGPLDMRMNNSAGQNCSEKLESCSEEELIQVIFKYGEERFAKKIARLILEAKRADRLHSTKDLADLIQDAIPKHLQERHKNPATRTFQALRLWVNQELESLQIALDLFPELLKIGGRAAFISFHSLEDRMVKTKMQALTKAPAVPRGLAVMEDAQHCPPMQVSIKMQKPSSGEVAGNPRSRSAILRVVERVR